MILVVVFSQIESDLRTIESERAGIEARKQAGAALQQELMQLEQSKALKVADKDQLRARIGTNMFDGLCELIPTTFDHVS